MCSTRNLELVQSLGADHVIDYTQQDFTAGSEQYDLIFDSVVGKTSFARCKRVLKPGGRYLAVAGGLREMLQAPRTALFGSRKVIAGTPGETQESMQFFARLLAEGKLKSPIDRCYPLEQLAEAHRYVDSGRKRGSVIIGVIPGSN